MYTVPCQSSLAFICIISLKHLNFMQQERQETASLLYREGLGGHREVKPNITGASIKATVQTKPSNSKPTALAISGQQIQTLLCSFNIF